MDLASSPSIESPQLTSVINDPVQDVSKISSQHGSQPRGFLRLPLELREVIYSLLLVRGAVHLQSLLFGVIAPYKWLLENKKLDPSERGTGILAVCKQISEEALNVLYGRNQFIVFIFDYDYDELLTIGVPNIQRIRHLRLIAQSVCMSHPTPAIGSDPHVWVPLLADLNRLCLVAQQPLRARRRGDAPGLEEDIRDWIARMEPVLQYISGNITKTTIVEIDDNDVVETGELVKKCFSSGYKKVRTTTGDKIFKRGKYSSGPDSWDDDDSVECFNGDTLGDDWSDGLEDEDFTNLMDNIGIGESL